MSIADYIPKGHRNAIPRQELAMLVNLSDRRMRKEIEDYVYETGDVVVNTGDGYFRYLDDSDIAYIHSYVMTEEARTRNLIEKTDKIRNFLRMVGDGNGRKKNVL